MENNKGQELEHQPNDLKPDEFVEPDQEPPRARVKNEDHAHLGEDDKALSPSELMLKEKKQDLLSAKKRYEELKAEARPEALSPPPLAKRQERSLMNKLKRALIKS